MKKFMWILIAFIPLCVLAQAATLPSPSPSLTPFPLPTPSSDPGLIGTISGLLSLAKGWQSMGVYAAIAAGLKLLTDLGSLSLIGSPLLKLPIKYQLLVKSLVAAALAYLGFLIAGVSVGAALPLALGTAAGSGFIHELIADFFPQLNTLTDTKSGTGT